MSILSWVQSFNSRRVWELQPMKASGNEACWLWWKSQHCHFFLWCHLRYAGWVTEQVKLAEGLLAAEEAATASWDRTQNTSDAKVRVTLNGKDWNHRLDRQVVGGVFVWIDPEFILLWRDVKGQQTSDDLVAKHPSKFQPVPARSTLLDCVISTPQSLRVALIKRQLPMDTMCADISATVRSLLRAGHLGSAECTRHPAELQRKFIRPAAGCTRGPPELR